MGPHPAEILSTLRDVPGVHGSFLVSPQGALLARDLAPMFTDDLLQDVGPRVVRLTDSFAAEGAEVLSCVLRYQEHALFVRRLSRGAMCLLMSHSVNMPALKMGVNLAVRRLAPITDAPAPAEVARPAPSGIQMRIKNPTPAPLQAPIRTTPLRSPVVSGPAPTSPAAAAPSGQAPGTPSAPRPAIQWRGSTLPKGR